MMTPDHPNVPAVKATLDELINAVSGHSFNELDQTYHKDMRTYLLLEDGGFVQNDKPGFMEYVQAAMRLEEDHCPWAEYHLVEASDTRGHILISRKNKVTKRTQLVTLSIDFIFEGGRWQIIREVIMTRSNDA